MFGVHIDFYIGAGIGSIDRHPVGLAPRSPNVKLKEGHRRYAQRQQPCALGNVATRPNGLAAFRLPDLSHQNLLKIAPLADPQGAGNMKMESGPGGTQILGQQLEVFVEILGLCVIVDVLRSLFMDRIVVIILHDAL